MRKRRHNGYALVLVIIAIFMASLLTLVAAKNARTLKFQCDRLQSRYLQENLQASALAWVKHRDHQADALQSLEAEGQSLPVEAAPARPPDLPAPAPPARPPAVSGG